MKQVVNGLLFDTENSDSIFVDENQYGGKELYRTNSGAWFLHHYSLNEKNFIEPVSEKDAFGFLQARSAYQDALEALLEHFSDRITPA